MIPRVGIVIPLSTSIRMGTLIPLNGSLGPESFLAGAGLLSPAEARRRHREVPGGGPGRSVLSGDDRHRKRHADPAPRARDHADAGAGRTGAPTRRCAEFVGPAV